MHSTPYGTVWAKGHATMLWGGQGFFFDFWVWFDYYLFWFVVDVIWKLSMKLAKLQLHSKILLGLVAGTVLGVAANRLGFSGFVSGYVRPFGLLFIKLISMVVVPLVFASLLVGTASLNDIRKLGRIGAKTLGYYLCTTAIAVTRSEKKASTRLESGRGSVHRRMTDDALLGSAENSSGASGGISSSASLSGRPNVSVPSEILLTASYATIR